jgi:hypothetical protein
MFRAIFMAAACAASIVVAGAAAAASKPKSGEEEVSYKWVDENGVVHYGDHVPPEYVKRERKVLNDQGVEVGRIEAEKTPEQRAIEAARAREVQQRQQHDQFLVSTYTSVGDLEAMRDQRLAQINGQTKAAEQYVATLDSRLTDLQGRALLFKPYSDNASARRMPDDLAADLVRTLSELRTQRNLLEAKRLEIESITKQFEADISRYRELKGV